MPVLSLCSRKIKSYNYPDDLYIAGENHGGGGGGAQGASASQHTLELYFSQQISPEMQLFSTQYVCSI